MSSTRKKERSKNDTWSEQELARFVGGGARDAKKKLNSTDPYGSPKTSTKSRPSGNPTARKEPVKSTRTTVPKPEPKKPTKPSSSSSGSSKREHKSSSDAGRSDKRDHKKQDESRSKRKEIKPPAQKNPVTKHRSDKDKSSKATNGSSKRHEKRVESRSDKSQASDKDEVKVKVKEQPSEVPQPMVEVVEEIAEEDYQYEEEFEEDYEEDFEEIEEEEDSEEHSSLSEDDGEVPGTPTNADVAVPVSDSKTVVMRAMDLVEIMQAMDTENQLVSSSTELPATSHSELPTLGGEARGNLDATAVKRSPSRRFVDFSSAQKKVVDERVSKITRKRGQELLSMIELDISVYDMFDLPPLSEYEVYVMKFGTDDTRQASSQTGEDNSECGVETEPVCCEERWTQCPPEDLRGYGGPSIDSDNSTESSARVDNSVELSSFLARAGQVCTVLLEENLLSSGVSSLHSSQSPFPFCSSSISINPPPLLSGSTVRIISCSPSQPHLLLASYSPATGDGGTVCVWDTREPSQPKMILVCQSEAQCVCFSPHKASLVFAGLSDGSLVLWDLREPVSMHRRTRDTITRVPTFSTAGIPQLDSHQSPVVTVAPISSDTGAGQSILSSGEDSSTGLSFQLASLDSSGVLHLWVVVEVLSPEPHGSDSDLGLVPLGRVKLVKSSSLSLTTGPAHCLQFRPGDTNHLYIGTDMGCVNHRTRYGRRAIPNKYSPACCSGDALSIDFCPWQPDLFLTGFSDGSVTLSHTLKVSPLVSWAHCVTGAVLLVQWIAHRPGVFLAQDSDSTIYLWDLLKNDAEPVYKYNSNERLSCVLLNQRQVNKDSTSHMTTRHPPTLTLAHSGGALVVHQLKDSGKSNEDKLIGFENYLNCLV